MPIVPGMTHSRSPSNDLPERLVWTLILGITTGFAAYGGRRLAAWAWTRIRAQRPPEAIGLVEGIAKKLGVGALKGLGA